MMKIALIDPVGGHGGMDLYDYGLACGLVQNSCEVYYFTANKTKNIELEHIHTLNYFGDLWAKKGIFKLSKFFRSYYQVFKYCKRNNIKTIHFQLFNLRIFNVLILKLAKRFKFKNIVTLHDIEALKGSNESRFEHIAFNAMDDIIVHNQFSFDELNKKNFSNNIHIIPHGNYLKFVQPVGEMKKKPIFQLLFFGQLKEVKGLDILLEAIRIIVNKGLQIKLVIVGKNLDVNLDQIKFFVKENQLEKHVEFNISYVPNEEVANYFQQANLVVLPYKKIYQSGVLLLTMSYGRPVLCSNLKPFTEIVEDGKNGYLFESENPVSLATKLEEIITNRNQLEEVIDNANKDLNSIYSWENIGKLTKKTYGE